MHTRMYVASIAQSCVQDQELSYEPLRCEGRHGAERARADDGEGHELDTSTPV